MKSIHSKLPRLLTCFVVLTTASAAIAEGIDRFEQEIWHPNQKQLESTIETGEVALYAQEYDNNAIFQTPEEAMKDDVGRLAQESGMSFETAERAVKAQQAFARYADKLLAKHPNRIARMWHEPAPSTKSHIQFVGNIPDVVVQGLKQNENPAGVSVSGGATIPFKGQVARVQAAAKGVRKSGYENSATFYDPANDVIQVEIKIPEYANRPDPAQILNAIQNELRGTQLKGYVQNIEKRDIKIKTIRGEGPLMEFDHSLGGLWLRDDGFRECTSGWSVNGPNGDGIITAGHCTGLNQIEQTNGLLINMVWRDQEFGAGGDVEYHTTSHIEPDDFYATAVQIRDVSAIRSTFTMYGVFVCEYGRSSNTRTCNHRVNALFFTVNYSQGTVSSLVRVTGDNSIPGDSGGGWSFNNTAWGVHSGSNGSESFFTPVQQAESILNVTIKR